MKLLTYILVFFVSAIPLSSAQSGSSDDWTWTDAKGNIRAASEYYSLVKNKETWIWLDANKKERSKIELFEILSIHKKWLDVAKNSDNYSNASKIAMTMPSISPFDVYKHPPEYYNSSVLSHGGYVWKADLRNTRLCKVDLFRANLQGADLSEADFSEANLYGANISRANLLACNFSHSVFYGTNLSESYAYVADFSFCEFSQADFQGIYLCMSKLTNCYFLKCNFENTILRQADLSDSTFLDSNLNNATLNLCKMTRCLYEPSDNPAVQRIYNAIGLDTMTYNWSPHAFVDLRTAFYNAGYYPQAKAVNVAYKRRYRELNSSGFWKVMEWFFFDWTCEYGRNAIFPLKIIFYFLLPIFGTLYLFFIALPFKTGITNDGRSIRFNRSKGHTLKVQLFYLMHDFFPVYFKCLFFSLLCTFDMGFREINLGRWLRKLSPWDGEFEAYGFPVRFLSGVQSILSVYLIALFFLSYFSRPFDGW